MFFDPAGCALWNECGMSVSLSSYILFDEDRRRKWQSEGRSVGKDEFVDDEIMQLHSRAQIPRTVYISFLNFNLSS